MDFSPALVRRAEIARSGLTDSDLRRLVARDELRRLRPGGFVLPAEFAALDQARQHATRVFAAFLAQRAPTVVTHQSAAVLHGLPIWLIALVRVHLAKLRRNAGRVTPVLHIHSTPLEDDEVMLVNGILVTTPSRTLIDLALSEPFEQAVVLLDAGLHAGLVTMPELNDALDRAAGRHGRARAALAVAFADGRSESVGESRSRVGMHRAGLPQPGLQRRVQRPDGSLVGVSDFDWGRLLGEFDGMEKYGRLLRPGEKPGDAVTREKVREDQLRELGYGMVRWTWTELQQAHTLWARVGAAIARCAE